MTPQDPAHVIEHPANDPEVARFADDYARHFMAHSRRRLRRHKWGDFKHRRAVRRHWGKALDKYLLTWSAIVDFAETFVEQEGPAAEKRHDLLYAALLLLHARACRLARAVHHDLVGGYVGEALVRCRTLYEVSVIAQVLASYGQEPEYADLAERYLQHKIVTAADDAKTYKDHRRTLELDPMDARQVTDIKTAREKLIKRFGVAYKTAYGWAVGLPGMKKDASFAGLIALTDTQHLRPYYRWASHHSHAGSLSAAWAHQELTEGGALIVGPTTSGLVEPASWALRSLCWTTESFTLGASSRDEEGYIDGEHIVWMVGIDRLLQRRRGLREGARTRGTGCG